MQHGRPVQPGQRHVLWGRLPDQRPLRELYWLSRMPGTTVTEVGSPRTHAPEFGIEHVDRPMRRPVGRFVEAGALGWIHDLGTVDPRPYTWVASLELCALVTGQMSGYAVRHGLRQAVVTWENLVHQPLYHLPPYSAAARRALGADLMICPIEAARDHLVALGYPEDRIAVVPPGVDVDAFLPAAAARRRQGPRPRRVRVPVGGQQGDRHGHGRHGHRSPRAPIGPPRRRGSWPHGASGGGTRRGQWRKRCATSDRSTVLVWPGSSPRPVSSPRPPDRRGSGTSSSGWPTSKPWRADCRS